MLALFLFMQIERLSPCKVNFILNILGRRPDGYHELETLMHPVQVCDILTFRRGGEDVQLTCSNATLPTDSSNLVHKAARKFFDSIGAREGVAIHLQKNVPLAAGLGGGSSNAAHTLLGLNELFGSPLPLEKLFELAAELGSDVPFFLQNNPALATGRGERVESLASFPALKSAWILLVHPGFGVSTPWAYKNLVRFPEALNGQPGRARKLSNVLQSGSLELALPDFYNSLEAPVLEKFPLLAIFKDFLREHGAVVAIMSGSGSSTFGLFRDRSEAENGLASFRSKFGESCWTSLSPLA